MPDPDLISILIPVFNEQDSLVELHRQLNQVSQSMERPFEIVMVDDGSTDKSWQIIEELAAQHGDVIGVRFRRNFGKAAAIRAGVRQSRGSLIATLDADLQDDPAEIPAMLDALGEDYDLISGWKSVRHDPIGKTFPSRVFNWLVGMMTGVKLHDHNCGFKLYRREVLDEVNLYGEMHRFIPVLATARGFRVSEIPVHHRPRQHGVSKYGWSRLPKGFLDLLTVSFLTGYHQRPQHVIGAVGLTSLLVGGLGVGYMTIYWVLRTLVPAYQVWPPLHERPLLLISLGAMLLGTQLLCVGFLAELIAARSTREDEPYTIREITD